MSNEVEVKEHNKPFHKLINNISELLGVISGIAILLMVIIVTFNVITRKFFSWSIPGIYEILGLIGAILYSFGIVYCAIRGQHIMMTLIKSKLPKKLQKVSNIVISIIAIVFCALFAYAGIFSALELLNEKTFDLRIPVAPFRFGVVIAYIMLGILILFGVNIGRGEGK